MPITSVSNKSPPTGGSQARLRLAPSPTGRLHLGHALSALINVRFAEQLGGRLLIRMEDIDLARCRPEYARAILEDLAWLGIRPPEPVLYQSEHFAVYRRAAQRLSDMGLLYPCFASRQEIALAAATDACDPDGAPLYPGLWRNRDARDVEARLAAGAPFALRLDMAKALSHLVETQGDAPLSAVAFDEDLQPSAVAVDASRWGDVVIQRKGELPSYHLAVVVDDARQGITHVVRGADLLPSTDVHRLLQALLGFPAPAYHHHRLLLGPDGRKLSKRAGDTGLAAWRAQGLAPTDIAALVGRKPQALRRDVIYLLPRNRHH
ncbi:MAG: tRNA glutamyl-Q(34) synthetase GluQRS [Hyphomicrobiaceae bacterium]